MRKLAIPVASAAAAVGWAVAATLGSSPVQALDGTTRLTRIPAAALQQENEFRWQGRLAQGRTIEVRGVNGDVRAEAAVGDEVEVLAVKRARRDDPRDVEIDVVEHEQGVTICAVYPSRDRDRPNECRPGGGRSDVRDNDVKVHFTVRVPAGVRLVGATVNGDVRARDLRSDIALHTVNGGIDLSTTGLAEARTVNGSIEAALGRADWSGALEFHTVNGGIDLELPAELNAEVRARTVNGDITSDFPLTVRGRIGPRRVTGVVGSGGRTLLLETVNGGIRLRRAS